MKQCGLWPVEDNDRSRGAWVGADAAPGWGDLVTLGSTYTGLPWTWAEWVMYLW